MPIQTPDTQIGDAALAATVHQLHRSLRGYGWVSGDEATPGPGVAITVPDDTEMWIDGDDVEVQSGSNTAQLLPHDRWPRWATIVVNDAGEVEAQHGNVNRPLEVDGEDLTGREGARPQPPIVTASDEVLHSLVWIPANASFIDAENVIDRRIDARVDAYNFGIAPSYDDADAVAAIEAEDPLDLSGTVNVAGDLTADGTVTFDDELDVDGLIRGSEMLYYSSRTSFVEDLGQPVIYRSGNGSDGVHNANGHLVMQPRSSITANIKMLVGSPTPEVALELEGENQNVEVPNGNVFIQGDQSATQDWVDENAIQNGESTEYVVRKNGSDGAGVLNFKT